MFCENTNVLQTVWPLEAAGEPQSELSDDAFKGSATVNAASGPLEAAGQPQPGPYDAFKGLATLNTTTGQQAGEVLFTAAAGGCVMYRKGNTNSRLR